MIATLLSTVMLALSPVPAAVHRWNHRAHIITCWRTVYGYRCRVRLDDPAPDSWWAVPKHGRWVANGFVNVVQRRNGDWIAVTSNGATVTVTLG